MARSTTSRPEASSRRSAAVPIARSDIEVLVHGYEQWGVDLLPRLRGMFALALWDGRTRTLVAARDRAGEKPLYWSQTLQGLRLASGSELLVRPEVSRELDPEALDQFLTYEYIVAPRTILKHVRKLPAASYLTWRDGRVGVKRYWDAASVPLRTWSDGDAVEALREPATGGRAPDDGRRAARRVPLRRDRLEHARGPREPRVAAAHQHLQHGLRRRVVQRAGVCPRGGGAFRSDHRERTVTPALEPLFDKLVVHLDEPFADVSMFPTYMVSSLAREHVTVALSGDGGDELFGGYDAYEAQALAARLGGLATR